MKSNFNACLKLVLQEEGGYANHPKDPGGPTFHGITSRTYNAWRANAHEPLQDIRKISDAEVAAIYRQQYADAIRFDDLPSGVDYAVFDYAVNSGPGRAARDLQAIVGETTDGQIGANTLRAVSALSPTTVIGKLCDRRLAFLKKLTTWPTFGKGWAGRITRVRSHALRLVTMPGHALSAVPASSIEPTPKADAADMALSKRPGVAGGGLATVGLSGSAISDAAANLSPYTEVSTIIKYVFLALMIAGVALTIYEMLKHSREAGA